MKKRFCTIKPIIPKYIADIVHSLRFYGAKILRGHGCSETILVTCHTLMSREKALCFAVFYSADIQRFSTVYTYAPTCTLIFSGIFVVYTPSCACTTPFYKFNNINRKRTFTDSRKLDFCKLHCMVS